MLTKVFLAMAVLVFVAGVVAYANTKRSSGASNRLQALVAQRADYLVFVGVPLAQPKEWAVAKREQRAGFLTVEGLGSQRIADVRAFVVAYPNHQLIDAEPGELPLPENITELTPGARPNTDLLQLDDLKPGRAFIRVTYGPSAAHPKERGRYSTRLKNVSAERVKVTRFAGYSRSAAGWHLSTVTSQFFSAAEFREWYGLGAAVWIEPGQTVADFNNYGMPPVLWAYYCETGSGKKFVVGEVLE